MKEKKIFVQVPAGWGLSLLMSIKKHIHRLVKNINSESPLLHHIGTTSTDVEKEEKFYYSTKKLVWFSGSNYFRKNPLLKQVCQKWKITSVPIFIYLRCICSNKPDLNPCVQESLGQHDMEVMECSMDPSLWTQKWADSVSTSCYPVAPAASAPVLPERDKLTTLRKTFNCYDKLKKPLSPQCTETMGTADSVSTPCIYDL